MIERVIILIGLIGLGILAYRLFNLWWVRRAERCTTCDPLLEYYRLGVPGVVLFTAEYCYPCVSQQQPALRRLAEQLGADKVQIIKVDVEADPAAARRWGVLSLPTTFILDKNGKPREVNHGVTSTEKLKRQLEALS